MLRSLIWDIVFNATIPAALYFVAKRFTSASEMGALLWAAIFPFMKSAYDLARHRDVDPVAVLILLGLVTSLIAVLFKGDARLLLIRESFFTGAFGLACLISLLFPRPLMFYFGRYFLAGKDAQRRERFDARWQIPLARRAHRLVTIAWGLVYVGEFALRVALVYDLPAPVVLVVSPFLTGLATMGAIVWTFWYANRVRHRMDQVVRQGAA
jgi:hypothetical protein